jgi:hypothetical protein
LTNKEIILHALALCKSSILGSFPGVLGSCVRHAA